ncbi:MAG TPA: PaaI family thioesterase [Solirubrobacterales bacterium]|jgi:uncharacterized protein (TIGR00369 family)
MRLELQPTVERIPAVRGLDLQMERSEAGLTFTGQASAEHANADDSAVVHGGVVGSILDTAATLAAVVHGERLWATATMSIAFVRAAAVGPLSGEAVIVNLGRTRALVRSELRGEDGRLCAEATVSLSAL